LEQYAWVAEKEGQILGFVSAFVAHSLSASRWEVDELAVHPVAQGRGVGTALVARAVQEGMRQAGLGEARALVAVGNSASQRVFVKNGFSPIATVDLLLYRVTGRVLRPQRAEYPRVRRALGRDARAIGGLLERDGACVATCLGCPDSLWLVAEQDGAVLGCAELIHVRTLQYEGFWIESLAVAHRTELRVASGLFSAAIDEAKRHATVDEVGYLASSRAPTLYEAGVGEGMTKVDEYLVFTQEFT
jgi:N-acetylglutamate synthase-like GNAT family acetyltransferase